MLAKSPQKVVSLLPELTSQPDKFNDNCLANIDAYVGVSSVHVWRLTNGDCMIGWPQATDSDSKHVAIATRDLDSNYGRHSEMHVKLSSKLHRCHYCLFPVS